MLMYILHTYICTSRFEYVYARQTKKKKEKKQTFDDDGEDDEGKRNKKSNEMN